MSDDDDGDELDLKLLINKDKNERKMIEANEQTEYDVDNSLREQNGNIEQNRPSEIQSAKTEALQSKKKGPKLHKCTECSYSSSTTSNLKSHLLIHTGGKAIQMYQMFPFMLRTTKSQTSSTYPHW